MHHTSTCTRVFKRYDPACPRCQELTRGAKPREGWGDRKRQHEADFLRRLDAQGGN